jgi:hypothetical protein
MVNNFEGRGADAHAALDAIAVSLASFSRSVRDTRDTQRH